MYIQHIQVSKGVLPLLTVVRTIIRISDYPTYSPDSTLGILVWSQDYVKLYDRWKFMFNFINLIKT